MISRSITLLGATGSIGQSTLDVVGRNPDRFRVEAVAGGRDAAALGAAARACGAKFAAIAAPEAYGELKAALAGSGIDCAAGPQAVVEAAERPADMVVAAISGSAGLEPALAAARLGRTIALANKECLVCAGALFMREAERHGATLLPLDSEHNAVFQVLDPEGRAGLVDIVLTASGGPFRTWTRDEMQGVTPEQALKHPNWSMGAKVTIDSATLMNKGLELIEAHHLFAVPPSQLSVLVHPQSIVHALVRYADGSVLAELAATDMRVPILNCLAYPERVSGPVPVLDLAKVGTLTFEAPDPQRFPALRLARMAMEEGGGLATVLNAADEIAVQAFLDRAVGFLGIAELVERTMEEVARRGAWSRVPGDLEEVRALDREARAIATTLLRGSAETAK